MYALLQSHPLGHEQLPESYSQRKVMFPRQSSLTVHHVWPDTSGWGPESLSYNYVGILTGLILCRSYMGYHGCCELMCTSAMSKLGASISQDSYSSFRFCHPIFLPTILKLKSYFYMCGSFAGSYICIPFACLVPSAAKIGHQILTQSYS